MALTGEKSKSTIYKTITHKCAEDRTRGSLSISLYRMDGAVMKKYGVRNIVTRSEQPGKAIRLVTQGTGTTEEHFLAAKLYTPLINFIKFDRVMSIKVVFTVDPLKQPQVER
jgi:DUF917 family protein